MTGRWDTLALRQGASVTLTFAIPPTLIARFAFDPGSDSGWLIVCWLVALLGFVLGAGVAASRHRGSTPLIHGTVASTGVFVVVQALLLPVRFLSSDSVSWGRIYVSLSTCLGAAVVGAVLGSIVRNNDPRMKDHIQ